MNVEYYFILLLIVLGVVLNSLVIVVNLYSWRCLHSKDIIVLSLAITDLLQSSFAYPYLLTDYHRSPHDEPTLQCIFSAFVATITSITSIAHFVSFSVKFCMAVDFPFWTDRHERRRFGALVFIVPCWLYGLIWAFFPLFGWSSYGKETEDGYRCGLNFREHTQNVVSYNATLVVFAFIFPISIALICNKRISNAYRRLYNQASSNSQLERDTKEQLYRTAFVNFVMLLSFALAWSPYATIVVFNIFGVQPKQKVLDTAAVIAKTSTTYNPVIYALCYKEFRNKIKKLVSR